MDPVARGREAGYAMATLLMSLAVMSILMSAAMPVWRHAAQREREAELVFRGEQYARAIELFQRKYAGAFPPSLDVLLEQRFLRKEYTDPMVEDGEFQLLYQGTASGDGEGGSGESDEAGAPGSPGGQFGQPGQGAFGAAVPGQSVPTFGAAGQTVGPRGGIVGVISKSKDASIREYNGRSRYSEWEFVYVATTDQPGAADTAAQPGQLPGGPGGLPFPGTVPGGMGQPGPGPRGGLGTGPGSRGAGGSFPGR